MTGDVIFSPNEIVPVGKKTQFVSVSVNIYQKMRIKNNDLG